MRLLLVEDSKNDAMLLLRELRRGGFDPEGSRSGVGRHSMRQRALELGGEIELRSRPGRGTRVLCRVPLTQT